MERDFAHCFLLLQFTRKKGFSIVLRRVALMAGIREISAAEFLQGTRRQTPFLQRSSPSLQSRLLWGKICNPSPRLRVSNNRCVSLRYSAQFKPRTAVSGNVSSSLVGQSSSLIEKPAQKVVHFFLVPLVQEGADYELLKSDQMKISNQIVGLRTEQC